MAIPSLHVPNKTFCEMKHKKKVFLRTFSPRFVLLYRKLATMCKIFSCVSIRLFFSKIWLYNLNSIDAFIIHYTIGASPLSTKVTKRDDVLDTCRVEAIEFVKPLVKAIPNTRATKRP